MLELLFVLVRNHGRILDKEFLLGAVWPDSFVEEGNITFNIRQLRKVLGDSAQSPTFIETIPRRGYRFIADVENVISEAGEEEAASQEPASQETEPVFNESRPAFSRFRYPLIAVSAVLITGLLIGGWYARTRVTTWPILSSPFASEKLSSDGEVYHAVISPDGSSVVYTHRSAGKQSLRLRQLENASSTELIPPGEYFYGGLAFSPDSKTVYFTRGERPPLPQLDIYRISILGGVPQRIISQAQGWISVSHDGEKISFVRCGYSDEDYCSLWIADTRDGGNEKKLVTRSRPIRIGDNKISPDGKTVVFAEGQSRTGSNDFMLSAVDIDSGTVREVTPQRFFNVNYIAWLPDQSYLLVTARKIPELNYRIYRISPATGEAYILTTDSETYSHISLNNEGSLAVSTHVEPDFHLNIYQNESPQKPRVLSNASGVTYAPNGRLFFSSIMSGDYEVWSVDPDGSDQRQLTNNPSDDNAPIVSYDGNFVYFSSNRSGAVQVWRMNSDGSNQMQVSTSEGGYPLRVSPDGRWVYYRSALQNSLRRVSVDSGEEQVIRNGLGRSFSVSPDTTLGAFTEGSTGTDSVITIVSLADGNPVKTFKISEPNLNVARITWSHDGRYLAYILSDRVTGSNTLWFQSVDGGPARHIADLNDDEIAELSSIALSTDGKSFAVIEGNWKHDAVLIRGLKN
jgi:Tol biopolymer transport system component/DNA-binding winged helix-turn-helix (wHTH) protein